MNTILDKQGLSLERLSTLLKIVDAGSIADAAGRDPSRQSLYSRQMSELAAGLELELFKNEGRNKSLTYVGKQVTEIVRAFVGAMDDLRGEALENPAPIRIGAGDAVNQWVVFPNAGKLEAKFQFNSFEFHNLRTKEVVDAIRSGTIDLGIVRTGEVPKGVHSLALRFLDFGLFYPKTYRGQKSLGEIVKAHRLISLSGEGEYTQSVKSLLGKSEIDYRVWIHLDSLPMIASAIRKFNAVAFLPLEAGEEMAEAGFNFIQPEALIAMRREYALIYSRRSAGIRTEIERVAKALAGLIR